MSNFLLIFNAKKTLNLIYSIFIIFFLNIISFIKEKKLMEHDFSFEMFENLISNKEENTTKGIINVIKT